MSERCSRIGLTGGIGSGKSTVASMLARCGAVILDSDAVSRSSTGSGGEAVAAIAAAFGPEFIDQGGALNRENMRNLVFRDPGARLRLEAIVHPIVQRTMALQERDASAAGCRLIVLDIPLLVESGRWAAALDSVLVVDCTIPTQIQRVIQRSAMARSQVQAIIASQATSVQRRRAADAVLWNEDFTLPALDAAVAKLAKTFGL